MRQILRGFVVHTVYLLKQVLECAAEIHSFRDVLWNGEIKFSVFKGKTENLKTERISWFLPHNIMQDGFIQSDDLSNLMKLSCLAFRAIPFIQQHSFCTPLGGALYALHKTINTPCYDTINHLPPNTQIQYQTLTSHLVSLKPVKRKRFFFKWGCVVGQGQSNCRLRGKQIVATRSE